MVFIQSTCSRITSRASSRKTSRVSSRIWRGTMWRVCHPRADSVVWLSHTSSFWLWSGAPKVRLYDTFLGSLRHSMGFVKVLEHSGNTSQSNLKNMGWSNWNLIAAYSLDLMPFGWFTSMTLFFGQKRYHWLFVLPWNYASWELILSKKAMQLVSLELHWIMMRHLAYLNWSRRDWFKELSLLLGWMMATLKGSIFQQNPSP